MARNNENEPGSDPSEDKTAASPSAPGVKPASDIEERDVVISGREPDAGKLRNTPPDNPFDKVKTRSNE